MTDYLLWLDVETTGLDPETDRLLEIAAAWSSMDDPYNVVELGSWVIWRDKSVLMDMPDEVRAMHTQSGLLEQVRDSDWVRGQVEASIISAILRSPMKPGSIHPAGSSVHFDCAFLREEMPRLYAILHHRHYDVSAIKMFCQTFGMRPLPKAEVHRAMSDVRESVEHAKACDAWMRNVSWMGGL